MLKCLSRKLLILLALPLFSFNVLSQDVVVETNHGQFVIQLDAEAAPITVTNFLRYVEDGSYVGSTFHRVIPGFMAQGGGFTEDFQRLETYDSIKNESLNGLENKRGSIAMARTQAPDSASRQFFINVKDNGFLNGQKGKPGYAVFGMVTEGMDVVDKIVTQPRGRGPMGMQDVPREAVIISSVTLK